MSGVSARRAPRTIQRTAGMLAKVGVRTCTRAGLRESSFQRDRVHDFAARRFDAAGGRAGDEGELVAADGDFAGGILVSAWRRMRQLSMISRARTKRRARTSPACSTGTSNFISA